MSSVHILEAGIKAMGEEREVVAILREKANDLKGRVRLPSRAKLSLSTRAGVGPRGSFSQVMMQGSGALAIEFGTRKRRAIAPLRSALRGGF